jgi:hypothetical protein
MKRTIFSLFVAVMLIVGVIGCTGFNANQVATTASDVALALVLNNNPQYKPAVVVALKTTKTFLEGKVTYDDLMVELAKYTGTKYAYIFVIIAADFGGDKPLFETYLPMLDSYKAGLITRIDRWILIASM